MKYVDRHIRSLVVCVCMLAFAGAVASAQETFYLGEALAAPHPPDLYGGPNVTTFPNTLSDEEISFGCECCQNDFGYVDNHDCLQPNLPQKPCLELLPGQSLYWQEHPGGYRNEEPLFHDSRKARLYASLESIALFRDQTNSSNALPIIPGGLVDFGNERFETEHDFGLRGTVGMAVSDWYRLEFAWLGTSEWSDRLTGMSGLQTETHRFESQFKSREINLRRRVRIRDWPQHYPDYWNGFEFSTLIGYRYAKLNEAIRSGVTPGISSIVSSSNKMAGLQIGGLAQWLYEDRGWIDLEVKGAILSNDLTVVTTPSDFNESESRTAFLVDASLMLNYQCTPCTTLRLGYNLIWLSGTALASKNVAAASAAALSANHSGESIFHGPTVGIVFAR